MKKLVLAILSVVLVVIDLGSKMWIEANLAVGQSIEVIPGFFDLAFYKNTGAAWSLFEGGAMRPVFLIISLVVSCAAIYFFVKETHLLVLISAALIFAGNLGNFYDRLMLGYVRDMLSFNLFGYAFPVFNVADTCLVIGFGFLALYIFLEERKGAVHEEN